MLRQLLTHVILIGTALAYPPRSGAETPAGKIPPFQAVLAINVAKYWDGPEAEALRSLSRAHPVVLTWEAMNLENSVGLRCDQIERVVVLAIAGGDLVSVVTTIEPFDRGRVLEKLVPSAAETAVRGNRYRVSEKSGNAVHFVDRRTFIAAPSAAIARLLDVPTAASALEKLAKPAGVAAGKTMLVAELQPHVLGTLKTQLGYRFEPFQPLSQSKSLRMIVEIDKGLRVTLRGVFRDEEAAKSGATALQKVVQGLASYLELAHSKMPAFLTSQEQKYPGAKDLAVSMARAIEAAQLGLKGAKAAHAGNLAETTIVISTEQPASTAVLLLSLAPRPRSGEIK